MTTVDDPVALDMSLDEVIARGRPSAASTNSRGSGLGKSQNKVRKVQQGGKGTHGDSGRQRPGRGGRQQGPSFTTPNSWTPWDSRPDRDGSRKRVPVNGRLLRISGLEFSVLQEDLVELFSAVGPVEKVWIDYDRTDRSLGTGSVIFENSRDALKAQEIYHGRSIDGSVISLELPTSNNNQHRWNT